MVNETHLSSGGGSDKGSGPKLGDPEIPYTTKIPMKNGEPSLFKRSYEWSFPTISDHGGFGAPYVYRPKTGDPTGRCTEGRFIEPKKTWLDSWIKNWLVVTGT